MGISLHYSVHAVTFLWRHEHAHSWWCLHDSYIQHPRARSVTLVHAWTINEPSQSLKRPLMLKFTHCARHILCVSMYWKNILVPWPMLSLASSPGQIISRSCGEKPWEHCYIVHRTESTVSGPWRSNVPVPSPDFSPRLRGKYGSGLGTRLCWHKSTLFSAAGC